MDVYVVVNNDDIVDGKINIKETYSKIYTTPLDCIAEFDKSKSIIVISVDSSKKAKDYEIVDATKIEWTELAKPIDKKYDGTVINTIPPTMPFSLSNYHCNDKCSYGYWNKGKDTVGCFCTEPTPLLVFDKESNMFISDILKSRAINIINDIITSTVGVELCTDVKMLGAKINDDKSTLVISYDCREKLYQLRRKMRRDDRNAIKSLPNFDNNIFRQITSIDMRTSILYDKEELLI